MNAQEFPELLNQVREGKVIPPNLEELTDETALQLISLISDVHSRGWFRHPNGRTVWAAYWFQTTQSGMLDGTGLVVRYPGKAFRFALCQHQRVTGEGANPRRGWYPGKCCLCGLDMTVDSGD